MMASGGTIQSLLSLTLHALSSIQRDRLSRVSFGRQSLLVTQVERPASRYQTRNGDDEFGSVEANEFVSFPNLMFRQLVPFTVLDQNHLNSFLGCTKFELGMTKLEWLLPSLLSRGAKNAA